MADGKLVEIQQELGLVEARARLAEAQCKLAQAESDAGKLRLPWWFRGLTLAGLATMATAMVPLTAQILSWKDQRLKEMEKNYEIRDKYLTTVIRDPRNEKRVLEFIAATTDDSKVETWAKNQLTQATANVEKLDKEIVERKKFYRDAITVVSKLADDTSGEQAWNDNLKRFWELYERDLLSVESPIVESLMARIGKLVPKGSGRKEVNQNFEGIRNLAYELARQMKEEIRKDALGEHRETQRENAQQAPDEMRRDYDERSTNQFRQ